MISVYSKDKEMTVWCSSCWWKDDWDGLDYGVDFDPQKPFLLQLKELLKKVPVMNLFGLYTTIVNSDYTNMVSYLKNCYLVTHSDFSEDCLYGEFTDNTKNSVDTLMLNKCEICYEGVNLQKCYRVFYSADCESCHDVYFSRNLIGCDNCFGCVNLRNKQYYIFNKPHSKEDYKKFIQQYLFGSFKAIEKTKKEAYGFWPKFPQKFIHERHNSNVTGDYIYNSKKTFNSFIGADMEDSRFCAFITPGGMKDSWDFTHYGAGAELIYDSLQVGNQASRILFSWFAATSVREVEYSMFIISGSNIFGSVGLKKKNYCILNKQYSKESFDKIRTKIIQQMNKSPYCDEKGSEYRYGEFFPIELSPFCYNETTAQEFFPLSAEAATKAGYKWHKPEQKNYNITLETKDILDHIKDVDDSITKEVIKCANYGDLALARDKSLPKGRTPNSNLQSSDAEFSNCTTAFKIIPQELQFYKRMNLPLPRLCPNCRHYQRIKQRNPLKLWHRKCQCAGKQSDNKVYVNTAKHNHHGKEHCPNEFETTYSPERKEIVYCEKCYQEEVV